MASREEICTMIGKLTESGSEPQSVQVVIVGETEDSRAWMMSASQVLWSY